jgi:hypothetical protein
MRWWMLPLVGLATSCTDARAPRVTPSATPAIAAESASAPASSSIAPPDPFQPKRVTLVDGAMGTKIQIQSFTTESIDEEALKAKRS